MCQSCMAINVHSSYKNMVEGTLTWWAIMCMLILVLLEYGGNHKIHLKIPACESQHVLQSICRKHIIIMG